jgi:cytochrome c-type biogenesis protein CcmF
VVAALIGARGDRRWVDASRRAAYSFFALLLVCAFALEYAFVSSDFSFRVVASHSSLETPLFYKFTAMWSSQQGSLLLWAFLLSLVASVSLYFTREKLRDVVPWATAIMLGVGVFFTSLMLFGGGVNPFETLSEVPANGVGLNPLLLHPAMMIHPPMLYVGYVSLTVPFAFAIGALISRRVDAAWIKSTRGFALVAWTFLTIGIILGARWSYTELGWGGYWAWDPVENASIMPWLITTAYIHSIMVQEKRGMLKVWNVSLIVASFTLALLGTFLVRSGILQSIHAFGDSTVGPYFLGLIILVLAGSTALIISRLPLLRSQKRIDSMASREAVFLINNLLLVAMCVLVFWGTFFPLISELFTGTESVLAAPWFDRYTTPLAVALVLFTGIGPLLAWRRISWQGIRRVFPIPTAAAAVALALLLLFTDAANSFWALAVFVLAAFTAVALAQETWRGAAARRSSAGGSIPASVIAVATRNRRRYGGYIVHLGFVVLLVGVAASSSFESKRDVTLSPGESVKVEDYTLTYQEPTVKRDGQAVVFGAKVSVEKDGRQFATLEPTRRYYQRTSGTKTIAGYFEGEATSEVGLSAGARKDFWVSIEPDTKQIRRRSSVADERFGAYMRSRVLPVIRQDPSQAGPLTQQLVAVQGLATDQIIAAYVNPELATAATFRVIVSPMVSWIWVGSIIAILGALFALWPARSPRRRKGA